MINKRKKVLKRKQVLMDTFLKKAKKLGYTFKEFPADKRTYKISKGNKSVLIVGRSFPFNSNVSGLIAKRKHLTKQVLADAGISTPKGILAKNWREVEDALRSGEISYPLVVKPDISSAGKMVTAFIRTKKELKKAFDIVKQDYKDVLVEEHCEGDDYRFLILCGKLLMVTKRGIPFITGDGKHTIADLIEVYSKKNTWPLTIDSEVKRCLKIAGYGLQDIPEEGVKIILRRNANNSSGGTTQNITKGIDKRFVDLAFKALQALGLRYSGVDILAPDITDFNKGYYITELNGSPGYDLSLSPKLKNPYDATEDILKALFNCDN